MGQLNCGYKEQDPHQINRLSLTISKYVERSPALSFTERWEIGQYLEVGNNQKNEQMWFQLISTINMNIPQSAYNQGLQINTSDLHRSDLDIARQECPYIRYEHDFKLLVLFKQNQLQFLKNCLSGIPKKLRWSIWKVLTLNDRQIDLSDYENFNDLTKSSDSDYCIGKDVTRTAVHKHFGKEIGVENLTRVLIALANKNSKLGYCQGMNYIAALLLMVSGLNEVESYSVFQSLLNSPRYMMKFLFTDNLPLMEPLEYLVMRFVTKKQPKVMKHFRNHEIPNQFWVTKMILSCFLYQFNYKDSILFLDYIIIKGTIIGYLELILAIIEYDKNEILKLDIAGVATFFQTERENVANDIIRIALKSFQVTNREIQKAFRKFNKSHPLYNLLIHFGDNQYYQIYNQMD